MVFQIVIVSSSIRHRPNLIIMTLFLADFFASFCFPGIILSAFFYGYLVLQIPGGWLALRIGAKRVLGYAIFIASAIHTCLPIIVRYNFTLFVVARVLQGLALVSHNFIMMI